ncbi:MAG: KTSC domain-containing protein [Gemmatimonadaceae bacterium]|nr:KTSC domain-containing protein [Chitinophagaceae bacterium]
MPSTVVHKIIYDAETKLLKVRFVSGMVYEYLDVPFEVYEAFMESRTKGVFLNTMVKGKYDFRKVDNDRS